VALCVESLQHKGAANVGGAWEIQPSNDQWMARSIAAAASHPLGAGDARYRYRGGEGEVHTVPFGAFSKAWMDRIGRYNESLLSNEDYEYNYRLRKAGGKIWYDPAIRSIYFSRSTFLSLAKQYSRYGFWKALMLVNHPQSIRWRQVLPALFTLVFLILIIFAIPPLSERVPLSPLLLSGYAGIYIAITVIFGMFEAVRKRDPLIAIGFPASLWTMHLTWGMGFLWALITKPFRRNLGRS
jgi:hypothetical protein